MFTTLKDGTIQWLKKPFDQDGTALNWFLFTGLMLAIGWLWSRVIHRI